MAFRLQMAGHVAYHGRLVLTGERLERRQRKCWGQVGSILRLRS